MRETVWAFCGAENRRVASLETGTRCMRSGGFLTNHLLLFAVWCRFIVGLFRQYGVVCSSQAGLIAGAELGACRPTKEPMSSWKKSYELVGRR